MQSEPPPPTLRLPRPATPGHGLDARDPRWVLFVRARCLFIRSGGFSDHDIQRLIAWGRSCGVSPMHVRAILAVARESGSVGSVTDDQMDRLSCVPVRSTGGSPPPRGRALLALVIWSATIALAMHLV